MCRRWICFAFLDLVFDFWITAFTSFVLLRHVSAFLLWTLDSVVIVLVLLSSDCSFKLKLAGKIYRLFFLCLISKMMKGCFCRDLTCLPINQSRMNKWEFIWHIKAFTQRVRSVFSHVVFLWVRSACCKVSFWTTFFHAHFMVSFHWHISNCRQSLKFRNLSNLFFFFALAFDRVVIKMHSNESRFVTGQEK